MPEPVAWDLAERIAVRVAGREPFSESYLAASLAADLTELTAQAEELVTEATGLVPNGPARSRVTDRAGWIAANVASFRRLLTPLTDRLSVRLERSPTGGAVTRNVSGAELGALLGWMSTRVLGQYDLLVLDDDPADQDIVYYVGPNVLALEKRFGFPPREFRLWLALHEVTHRAQFTGVPWLAPHYVDLVQRTLGDVDPDPKHFVEALKRAAADYRSGKSPLRESGLAGIFASADQRQVLAQIGGMMSLLEGHGDVTMDRAGRHLIPSADRFSGVLHARRNASRGAGRLVRTLLGLEGKLDQYEMGEHFVRTVEAAGGRDLFDEVWSSPDALPSMAEIREPAAWIDRMSSRLEC